MVISLGGSPPVGEDGLVFRLTPILTNWVFFCCWTCYSMSLKFTQSDFITVSLISSFSISSLGNLLPIRLACDVYAKLKSEQYPSEEQASNRSLE